MSEDESDSEWTEADVGTDVESDESPFDQSDFEMGQAVGSEGAGAGASPHKRERPQPGVDGHASNNTKDLVDFEFVYDEDDEFTPREVIDAGGIIVTPDDDYVGLAKVKPRSWGIHTDEKKDEIIQSFQSAFISTLDFYVQIVCYPTEFDMSEHVDMIQERVQEMGNAADEHPLIQFGREMYPHWLTNFIEHNDMKQRDYYVVVRVDPEQLKDFDETDSVADKVAERAEAFEPIVRAIEGAVSGGGETSRAASRERCIREVGNRLDRIKGALQRIDVEVERIRNRDEAMSVLFHYYNNYQPLRTHFDVGTRTTHDPNAPVDTEAMETDDLLRPNFEPQEEEL
jgi:hypothetical protein